MNVECNLDGEDRVRRFRSQLNNLQPKQTLPNVKMAGGFADSLWAT